MLNEMDLVAFEVKAAAKQAAMEQDQADYARRMASSADKLEAEVFAAPVVAKLPNREIFQIARRRQAALELAADLLLGA